MNSKTSLLKVIFYLSITSIVAITLTSCSVPAEVRHKNINDFLNQIDAYNSPDLILEETDKSGGVLTPSWVRLTFNGETTFEDLKEKITKVPNIKCDPVAAPPYDKHFSCNLSPIDIQLDGSKPDGNIYLKVNDNSNGN